MLDLKQFDPSNLGKKQDTEERETRISNKVPASNSQERRGLERVLYNLLHGDFKALKEEFIESFIIPGIENSFHSAIDRAFHDGTSDPRRYGGSGTNYNIISHRGGNTQKQNFVEKTNTAQRNFGLDDIYWDTRPDAIEALAELQDTYERFGMVRVADVFDVANKTQTGQFTGNDWGWRDFKDVSIGRTVYGKYYLVLPKPVSLK